MALCGSFNCGCGITSTPAVSGLINGYLPNIDVSGSGEPGDPYSLSLDDGWAQQVSGLINRHGARATRVTTQSMTTVTLNLITWTAETEDTDGYITPTSGTFTIPAGLGGLYALTLQFALSAAPGGYIRVAAGGVNYDMGIGPGGAFGGTIVAPLAAADTVTFSFYNTGSTANLNSGIAMVYRVAA